MLVLGDGAVYYERGTPVDRGTEALDGGTEVGENVLDGAPPRRADPEHSLHVLVSPSGCASDRCCPHCGYLGTKGIQGRKVMRTPTKIHLGLQSRSTERSDTPPGRRQKDTSRDTLDRGTEVGENVLDGAPPRRADPEDTLHVLVPPPGAQLPPAHKKVDIRLPGKGNSNSHGARPVY